ncbi:hypothetical protein HK096_003681, partial [Nowakowskiella sp. JEL0078]
MWKKYIDFNLTNVTVFNVSTCVEVFEKWVTGLRNDRFLITESGKQKEKELDEMLIFVLQRLCVFLSQSGYNERAVALYQAIIEFNFFCPLAFKKQTFDQRIDMFEMFWEDEGPRFGDSGAKGWMNSKSIVGGKEDIILDEDDNILLT